MKATIKPVQVGPDHCFKFKCHQEVECFTKCCRGITITLTPYDIVRLKNRLNLSSEEFLAIYTQPRLLEKTDLPVVTLKLLEDEDGPEKPCPFVKPEGCIVYEDRPTTCRYYPLGIASLSYNEEADDGFYFFVNEPHCKGFQEDHQWSVRDWRLDQGVDIHDQINAGWTDLLVRKRSFPPNIKMTDQSKQLFFMAAYNIDKFRKFVLESSFLERYPVDQKTLISIKSNEVELLRFAFKWLTSIFFTK